MCSKKCENSGDPRPLISRADFGEKKYIATLGMLWSSWMMTFIPLASVAVCTFCAGMRVADSSRAARHLMGLKYHKVTNMRRSAVLLALLSATLCAQDSREVMNRGIAAFKAARYREAVESFQQAVSMDPNAVNPHLYLGTAYMSLWIPANGIDANAQAAETELKRVLELDPNNTTALSSVAYLAYNSATGLNGQERINKFDEAMDWYKRLAIASRTNKEAPYSMGVIAWAKWYRALMTTRASLGMKPEDPGPLPSPQKDELKEHYSALLEEGIENLNHALLLDPQYDDAMAYLNLLIRERADLRDTKAEYLADVAIADNWVQKTLDTKKMKAQSGASLAPPPPPPPPPPASAGTPVTPQRVSGSAGWCSRRT